jgi:putative DNA primase/helicase
MMNTVADILGDYHCTAAIETFTITKNEQHPTELAMLRGARLVTASETEEGQHWAESRIKKHTGDDKISARFMRQDFFEYAPQFKLIGGAPPHVFDTAPPRRPIASRQRSRR